ncbi:MAG: hypothetical protein Kow0029_22990 [Candidatus Rifleibacteriota bacterium]
MNKKLFSVFFFTSLWLIFLTATCSFASGLSLDYKLPADGRIQPADWQIRLQFNENVSILEISKRVKLEFAGQKADLKVVNAWDLNRDEEKKSLPPERKIFVLKPAAIKEASGTYRIMIDGKLTSADGKSRLLKDRDIVFNTAPGTTLLGFKPYFSSPDNKGVQIYLSERVKDYQLKKKIKIFPPIGYFNVNRIYDRYQNIYQISGKFITGRKYKIDIGGGSLGEKEHVLNPDSFEFTSVGPNPEIRFAADRSVLELHSRQTVPLSFANVGNFKCQFMSIPAYFAPMFDSLAIFPSVEEKRPSETTSFRLEGNEKKAMEATARDLDNLMMNCVNRLNALKSLPNIDAVAGLSNFLLPDFTSRSEGFLGSEDPDKEYFFALPLDARDNPTCGGSLIIRVNEIDVENGQQATRLFQITDLSITYKFSRDELLLWVTSIETGKPVANAAIMIEALNNRSIFPGKTDRDGIIRISQNSEYDAIKWTDNSPEIVKIKPAITDMLIAAAATENDSSFIRLSSNRFAPSSVSLAYPDRESQLGSKGHVFTERGVYKQGETVFWKATVREYADKSVRPVSKEKVSVSIRDPKGEEIYSEKHVLNEFGTCSGTLKLAGYAPLGQYNIKVNRIMAVKKGSKNNLDPAWDFLMNRPSTKANTKAKPDENPQTEEKEILLTSAGFQVQEFEPPRHYVDISMKIAERKVKMVVGRETEMPYLECTVKSLYYTGGPLRHARVQWTAHLTERDSSEKDFPLYQFGNNDTFKELIESGNAVLDKNGELKLAIPVSESVLSGINSIMLTATVLDVDARPSTAVKSYQPSPEYKVGISKLPGLMTQGQEFPVQVIVLDKNGNKLTHGKIKLEIMRKKYFYTQKRDASGGIYYNWTSGWVRNQSATREISGDHAKFDLVLGEGGDYMLMASFFQGDNEYKSAYSFYVDYSYASFEDINNQNRVRSENEVVLMPDKTVAQINSKVKVRYTLPSNCEYALITAETDEILDARVVKLDKPVGEFIQTINENCRPNVYIGMIAPTRRTSFPVYTSQIDSDYPRAYFGYTNIKVQNTIDKLHIAIAPDQTDELKAGPGDEVEVSFRITDRNNKPANAEVAICIVDEAVLSLTGFVTPVLDSLADFMLPLTVFTGDLRTSLISQELYRLISTRALTGGDGGAGTISADLDIRKDFKPVVYWNPALYPDSDGVIKINCKMPDSMTSYRVYAVAVDKGAAFASAERQFKVSKDFYLEPGLPRFLVAGDKAVFPLSFNNKADNAGKASYQVIQAENLTITPTQGEVELTSFNNSTCKLNIVADNGAGKSKIVVSGEFNGLKDAIQRELPVKPASTIIHRIMSGHFKENHGIKPEIPDYVRGLSSREKNGTLMARLTLSTSPWAKIAPSLSYMLRYPYGCVEQTSSGIIPLSGLRALIKEGRIPNISLTEVDRYLGKGIDRLFQMQTPSGAFAYWPGDYQDSWWGTQYAVMALTMAKKAGFEIDEDRFSKAIASIRTGLFGRYNDGNYKHGIMALAVVNLAMNGKITPEDIKILRKRFTEAEGEASPLLILAEALSNSTDKTTLAAKLKTLKPSPKSVQKSWYYSSTREDAFSLMAILAADGDMKQADEFAGALLSQIGKEGRWHSTADTGFALLALSQYFMKTRTVDKENVELTVKTGSGEKKVNTGKYGASVELGEEDLLSEDGISINCADKALVNWSLEYSYPDLEDRTNEVNKGFSISKTFKNLNGKDTINVGDLVKVTIEFEDNFHKDDKYYILNYLALEDPIPAGFIPVNSSLKNDSLPPSERENEENYCSWHDGAYTFYADHQEMQIDRLLAFKNRFWSGRFRLVYYVRAVCEGEFKMKPTRISLMYDPEIYGMTAPSSVKVLPGQ